MHKTKSTIAVFIDASNVHYARHFIWGGLNFSSLKEFFLRKYDGDSIAVFYYSAYPQDGTRSSEKCDSIHKFFVLLQKRFGFIVRKKPLKTIKKEKGWMMEKWNLDVEMTIDIIKHLREYDIFILFTGDSDFMPVVTEILSEGKRVYIYSTKKAVSIELTTGASGYEDIIKHPELISVNTREKPHK